MTRTLLAIALSFALPVYAAPSKAQVEIDLGELCALVDQAQTRYYKVERELSDSSRGHRHFRCSAPSYALDGCDDILGARNLVRAAEAGFAVDIWRGGSKNGDGDGYSCSAMFADENKRLAPTKRVGSDGLSATSNHRSAHGWTKPVFSAEKK